jgi:hypothetical protein
VIRMRRINKSNRLAAVDGLQEGVVHEGILHIGLANQPGARDGQGEHGVDPAGLTTKLKVSS